MDTVAITKFLRWSMPAETRPRKGRWIVLIVEVETHMIIVGYRFQSKAEARSFARKRTEGRVRAIVRRYHRRQWVPRKASWTSVATETIGWAWAIPNQQGGTP